MLIIIFKLLYLRPASFTVFGVTTAKLSARLNSVDSLICPSRCSSATSCWGYAIMCLQIHNAEPPRNYWGDTKSDFVPLGVTPMAREFWWAVWSRARRCGHPERGEREERMSFLLHHKLRCEKTAEQCLQRLCCIIHAEHRKSPSPLRLSLFILKPICFFSAVGTNMLNRLY